MELQPSNQPSSSPLGLHVYNLEKPKAGVKTSEFWVVMINNAVGVAVMLGYLSPDQADSFTQALLSVMGGLVVIASTVAYVVSRIKLKSTQPVSSTPEAVLLLGGNLPDEGKLPEMLPTL